MSDNDQLIGIGLLTGIVCGAIVTFVVTDNIWLNRCERGEMIDLRERVAFCHIEQKMLERELIRMVEEEK